MWWDIDIFVVYFVRCAILSTKKYKSRAWPEIKASVMSANCDPAPGKCKIAEVYYKYYVDGICYADVYKEPFIWHDSGETYVKRFEPGTEITIRVKPGDPSVSFACISRV